MEKQKNRVSVKMKGSGWFTHVLLLTFYSPLHWRIVEESI